VPCDRVGARRTSDGWCMCACRTTPCVAELARTEARPINASPEVTKGASGDPADACPCARDAFVVDKTNIKYLYLGLIALTFSHARIINVTRDFHDVVLSLHFSDFEFLWNGFLFDIEYERLVVDFDVVVRDMLKNTSNNDEFFVGLISGAARR
jgi:hypothetical protein